MRYGNYSLIFRNVSTFGEVKETCLRVSKLAKSRLKTEVIYIYRSVCLFGTDNNSSISGIWIWRGQQLAFELCPDW
jgi:hypothetical protein